MKAVKANNKGMTLLEVLVAVFVLALVALPLLNMFVTNTALVRNAKNVGDTTYAAQAVMEDLQPLGYMDLYAFLPEPGAMGDYTVGAVTRKIRVDRCPSGVFDDLVSGTPCYAHLIVNGAKATFTSPDGALVSGISSAQTISIGASAAKAGSSTLCTYDTAGKSLIVIINARTSEIPSLTVNLNGSATYVLFALSPSDPVVQNISVTNPSVKGREYRKYNSKAGAEADAPPAYMLVNAVCRVYKPDGTTLESIAQNTLKVNLP
jgi:prepilin-type N-terminal cleavage/methylation domain-containing protein